MKNIIVPILMVLLVATMLVFFGNSEKTTRYHGLIFTQVPADVDPAEKFPHKGRIVIMDPKEPESYFEVMTSAFQSARSPQISSDGKRLLFAGRFKETDLWQIWEMTLASRKIVQITRSSTDCTDPAYLPDGKILYSARVPEDYSNEIFALFTIDGQRNAQRISFQPHSDLYSVVMLDGRILTNSRQVYPQSKTSKLLALRPDGTKAVLYYQSPWEFEPTSRPYETEENRLVFVETQAGHTFGNLISLNINRPLHSRIVLSESNGENGFNSVFPLDDGKMIVSYKNESASTLGIYNYNPSDGKVDEVIYSDENWNSLEPQQVSIKQTPKILPTTIDFSVKSGKMICMNSGITDLDWGSGNTTRPHTINILGVDQLLGSVEVENDGSFYVELSADTPVRFQALDNEGNEILKASSWLWVRPNESRGCIGCHEDRELTPNNQVPHAITHNPVSFISPIENAE